MTPISLSLSLKGELDTFMVYNERKRVTSSAKKKRKPEDKSLHQVSNSRIHSPGTVSGTRIMFFQTSHKV
jgi:hypothetical protein